LGQQCEQAKQRKSALPNVRTFAPYSDFVLFSSSSSFSFFYVFSLFFFRSTEQEHKQVSAQWDLFVQNEEHVLRTRGKIPDYGGIGLWIFFVWCIIVVLVYCTNKIEELKDRIIRRKHKIQWQQRVFYDVEGGCV
jgi:hypothetical protein